MSSDEFCCSCRPLGENERMQKDRQIFGSCKRAEKAVEHKADSDANNRWCTRNSLQGLRNKTGGIGNQRKNLGHTDHSIVKIRQNPQNSSGDLRKLAIIHTSVKDHQLLLVRKTNKEGTDNSNNNDLFAHSHMVSSIPDFNTNNFQTDLFNIDRT